MKKRKTIYVDEELWRGFRIKCLGEAVSVSSAVEGLIRGDDDRAGVGKGREVTIEDLAKKQSELDAVKAKRNIKQEKIAQSRAAKRNPISSLTGFSGGYSKSKQVGK